MKDRVFWIFPLFIKISFIYKSTIILNDFLKFTFSQQAQLIVEGYLIELNKIDIRNRLATHTLVGVQHAKACIKGKYVWLQEFLRLDDLK